MNILFALIGLSVIGIGAVLWLLKNDPGTELPESQPEHPSPAEDLSSEMPEKSSSNEGPKPKFSLLLQKFTRAKKKPVETTDTPSKPDPSLNLFKRIAEKLNFGNKDPDIPEVSPLPSLKDYLAEEKKQAAEQNNEETAPPIEEPQAGTASIRTVPAGETAGKGTLSEEEEKSIEKEIDLTTQLNELEEKYSKLDVLFNEKSSELEKTQESLDSELKNRKEFNKVKDILEKELKDSKDKARNVQVELNNAQTEGESQKKRVAQLEEKVTKLEKNILEKEDKIGDLVKRLQTFASPSTAATLPVQEEPSKTSVHLPNDEKKEPQEGQASPQQREGHGEDEQPQAVQEPVRDEIPARETLPETGSEEQEEGPSQDTEKPQPYDQPQDHIEKKEEGEESAHATPPAINGGACSGAESPDEQPQEEQFLKLQPDVFSQEPPGGKSAAEKIEQSLGISYQSDVSSPSETDLKNEDQDQQPSQEKETADPKQQPPHLSDNRQSNQQDNHNTSKED